MRHYEIVFLVHPDQSEQVPAMVDRYRQMVERVCRLTHPFYLPTPRKTFSRINTPLGLPFRTRRSDPF